MTKPLFEFRSYGRPSPVHRDRLPYLRSDRSPRMGGGAPEVVVKVSGGASSAKRAIAHYRYIDRKGELDIQTDDGVRLHGRDAAEQLVRDWQLDLDELQACDPYRGSPGRRPAKLTHHIVLSMPAGTSPQGLFDAAKHFAREQFALKHRYAMVLHTDQAHPHVHLVVRALDENGERIRIRKDTLRAWRAEFAKALLAQGIAARATMPRDVERRLKSRGRIQPETTR